MADSDRQPPDPLPADGVGRSTDFVVLSITLRARQPQATAWFHGETRTKTWLKASVIELE